MRVLVDGVQELNEQIADDSISAAQINPNLVTGYLSFYNRVVKRILDVFFACILTICLFPVGLVVALAIVIEDGFPVFYRAERGGYLGKPFYICKFRSMIRGADKIGRGTTALHDNRITKVGSVIRKLKIDEFPNLLNILKGDMSFIGPRPDMLRYTNAYSGTEKFILNVRPGISDYSSIAFINLDEMVGSEHADDVYEQQILPQKNKLRVKYAATVSFYTDVRLFVLTVWKVLEKGFNFLIRGKHR